MTLDANPHLTENGFTAGAAEVICVANVEGYQVLWVQTATTRIEIVVTPKGRRISVKEHLAPVDRRRKAEKEKR